MNNLGLNTILNEYNYNHRLYHENISRIINLIEQSDGSPRPRTTQNRYYATSSPTQSNQQSNRFRPRTLQEQILFFLNSASATNSPNSVGAPTAEQIQNATENMNYSADLIHTICPISLEAFQDQEPVTRIRHCGHIFRQDCLRRWFENHDVCPVCRYSITSTSVPLSSPRSQTQRSTQSSSIISQLLHNLLDFSGSDYGYEYTYNTSIGNTGNMLYEITIPLFQNGASSTENENSNGDAEDETISETGEDDTDVITIGNISVD